VGDKQDALAMAALQMANQVASLQNLNTSDGQKVQEDERLKQIQTQLETVINVKILNLPA
jgi:hypothetical protein